MIVYGDIIHIVNNNCYIRTSLYSLCKAGSVTCLSSILKLFNNDFTSEILESH